MIYFAENHSLKDLNTFKLDVKAKYFFSYSTEDELFEFQKGFDFQNIKLTVLGGGSNVLFKDDFDGLVLHPEIKGIEILSRHDDHVLIKAGAGVNWDDFVLRTVTEGLGGIENLSLIPGTVGASPIQNIGAYGVEVKDLIVNVEAYDYHRKVNRVFSAEECMFDYRNSIFKNKYKNRYVIHAVTFRLYRNPVYITNYGNLKEELSKFPAINLGTIRQSVINIRNSKLPDPAKLPNAGSFFKNPCISTESAESLQQKYKDVPLYKTQDNGFKISAAWLIERCGWKGRREGNCGIHKDHSLVIVNYGNSTGKEILNLAVKIKDSVREKFNIDIETEVDIV